MLMLSLSLSSLRKRLKHEGCINEGVSVRQSYVGKSVVSLLILDTATTTSIHIIMLGYTYIS